MDESCHICRNQRLASSRPCSIVISYNFFESGSILNADVCPSKVASDVRYICRPLPRKPSGKLTGSKSPERSAC